MGILAGLLALGALTSERTARRMSERFLGTNNLERAGARGNEDVDALVWQDPIGVGVVQIPHVQV